MIVNGLIVLGAVALLFAGYAIVAAIGRRDDRRETYEPAHRRDRHDPFAGGGPAVSAGFGPRPPGIASEPPPQFWPEPYGQYLPAPAAAVESPPSLPPPPVHHDEYAPAQRWHEPDPGAEARDTCQRALAVGALIAATHAQVAERDRARAAQLAAEARETRPWAEDTGSFAAICADVMEVA